MKIVKSKTDIKIKSTTEGMWSWHCLWCENAISTQTRTLPEAFNSASAEPFPHFYKIWIDYDILYPCGTVFLCMVEYNKLKMLSFHHDTASWLVMFVYCTCIYFYYSADALEQNQELEFERNKERFVFLKVLYIL